MIYGAKNIKWAPITAEPVKALPTYGEKITLGELNQVVDAPAFNEVRASGDDHTARYAAFFKEVPIDVTILDMTNENAAAVTGATIENGDARNLRFKTTDKAPYGGLGFHVSELMEDNEVKHKGIFFPKAKAVMQGQTYDTKGETVVLQGKKLRFLGLAAKSEDWKIEAPYFDTEEEADAWVDQMLGGAAAAAAATTDEPAVSGDTE